MKILADESVDFPIVKALRQLKYDITYIIELNPGIKDIEVLTIANSESRILLTADKDFGELVYRTSQENKGVVLFRLTGFSNDEKIKIVINAFESYGKEFPDCFVVISNNQLRIRKITK